MTLQISGVFGVYVAFIAPALLQLFAQREDPRYNMYSGPFSSVLYIYLVLANRLGNTKFTNSLSRRVIPIQLLIVILYVVLLTLG